MLKTKMYNCYTNVCSDVFISNKSPFQSFKVVRFIFINFTVIFFTYYYPINQFYKSVNLNRRK